MNAFSIIIPTLNDELNIEKNVIHLIKKLKKIKLVYEIIIVNDGSKDNTSKILKKLKKKNKKIKIIHNAHNLGKSSSVRKGLKLSKYKKIVLIDSDLPYLDSFEKIIKKLNRNYDFVFVNRRHKKSLIKNKRLNFYQFLRYLIGFLISFIIKIVLKFNTVETDTQSGLKGFKKLENFEKLKFISKKFFLDLELMYYYKLYNKRFFSVPVKYTIDKKSSIKIFSIMKNIEIIYELMLVLSNYKKN
tara:strand:+ start:1897 stop:2628 length:732 start_codon:yes stop_codon:yes gene_type:complete